MNRHSFGTRIIQLRDERGESQEDVAREIGESRETVRNWEVGTRNLKAEAIIKLAKHFGVTADYLLGLSDVKSPEMDVQTVCQYTGLSEAAAALLHALKDYSNRQGADGGSSQAVSLIEPLNKILMQDDVIIALSDLTYAELTRNYCQDERVSVKDCFDSVDALNNTLSNIRGIGVSLISPDTFLRLNLFEAKQYFSNAIDKAFGLEHQNSSPETK